MQDLTIVDWDTSSDACLEQVARFGSSETIRALLSRFVWGRHPAEVLGGIMTRKDVDLATALNVFFSAIPLQYNYIGKRDVPSPDREMCQVLDSICMRLNCGYYLPISGTEIARQDKLRAWIKYQLDDSAEGRAGRWVLDENIVGELVLQQIRPLVSQLETPPVPPVEDAKSAHPSLIESIILPLIRIREQFPFSARS